MNNITRKLYRVYVGTKHSDFHISKYEYSNYLLVGRRDGLNFDAMDLPIGYRYEIIEKDDKNFTGCVNEKEEFLIYRTKIR